jgi:hypothetical protein
MGARATVTNTATPGVHTVGAARVGAYPVDVSVPRSGINNDPNTALKVVTVSAVTPVVIVDCRDVAGPEVASAAVAGVQNIANTAVG